METKARTIKLSDIFPTTTCKRCGGSGSYSFNPMDGDLCYGCNGSGWNWQRGKVTKVVHEYIRQTNISKEPVDWKPYAVKAGLNVEAILLRLKDPFAYASSDLAKQVAEQEAKTQAKREKQKLARAEKQREADLRAQKARQEQYAVEQAKASQKREKFLEQFKEQYPDHVKALEFALSNPNAPDFVRSIANSVVAYEKASEKQLYWLLKTFNTNKPEASSEPISCPSGKQVIKGKIITTKWVESPFYGHSGTLKMLVRDDRGFKVWGTMPASLQNAETTTEEVTFTATVEPSQDDPNFGFYSRPTKASYV